MREESAAGEGAAEVSAMRATRTPRVTPQYDGPLLMEGPVEVVMPDGTVQLCERPTVALCTCRRSQRFPFCDTSHRTRVHLADGRRDRPRTALTGVEDQD
jgi:CDGSH-type Zn-finger protein